VVVGFAALLTTPLSETRSVGIGGLIVVGVAVLLSVSLLPGLLALLGRQIDRPRWLARPLARVHAPTGWERWARWLGRRPWRAIAIGGSIVSLCSYPLVAIRFGLPAANWFPPGTESGRGLAALRHMGAAGVITPVRVVVQFPEGETALSGARLRGLKALSDSLRREPRVRSVRGVATVRPGLSALQLFMFYSDPQAVRDRYPEFFGAYLSTDGRTTLIDVIPADTVGFTGMMDLARRVRELAAEPVRGLDRAEIAVGGFAATSVDLQDDLLADLPSVVGLILGTTALMLFIAFRSLLVPLKAVLLNCLSVAAAFGVTVLVFQEGLGARMFGLEAPTEAIFVVVPVLVFATVFGLSMDYEVFLLARIKEIFDHTGRNDHATMEGLSATASVITFAAVIMVLVFGVFAFARVLAVQFIGFGLAIAVLLDATIIRMILVPAIMHIAGRWNWWPGVRGAVTEPEE
jgi:RND superfamily putative drug exporter